MTNFNISTPRGVRALQADFDRLSATLTSSETTELQKKVTLSVLESVIRRTPQDEGIARGGWQVSIGVPSTAQIKRSDTNEDPTSTTSFTQGKEIVAKLTNFQVVFISNNVPYITVLDQGLFVPPNPGPSKDPRPDRRGKILVSGGFSTQAPSGIVDLALEKVRSLL